MTSGKISWGTKTVFMVLTLLMAARFAGAEQRFRPEREQARQILDASGVRGGLVIHVACGDGKLTAALRANNSYLVHGLDVSAANIEKAREHISSLGIYGKVSAETFDGNYLPYTDNLINLIVSENLGRVSMDEVMRVLCPNGVAYIKKGGKWIKTIKPRPDNIDEWSHFLHDPTNDAVADDDVVGPPYHLQWVGAPRWGRSHEHLASMSAAVASGGRLFYILDEGPVASVTLPADWRLVARDAFSGVLLWKRDVDPWEDHLRGFRSGPSNLARRLVAVGDRVYVTLGYGKPVTALDAATGETVRTYPKTAGAREILCDDGVLYVVAGEFKGPKPASRQLPGGWQFISNRTESIPPKRLLAIRADTGQLLWEKDDSDTADVMPTALAVADGRVFFESPKAVICLDAETGGEVWSADRPASTNRPIWSGPTLVVRDGVVLSADRAVASKFAKKDDSPNDILWVVTSSGGNAPPGKMMAFSAATGERLWEADCREVYNAPVDVLVSDGLIWSGNMVQRKDPGIIEVRDLKTGEVRKTRPADQRSLEVGMFHHRCYRNKATNRYVLMGRAGVEFIDTATDELIPNHWVRGTCQYGIMPCNGMLYAPPHSCACYIRAKLSGFNALAPKRAVQPPEPKVGDDRLTRGPAYSAAASNTRYQSSDADWSTYRHDPGRSGATRSVVAPGLATAWQRDLGGRLSSMTVAGGRVYVALVDEHTVCALDATSGEPVWRFTAGGRVDSPPTVAGGRVLFGSADGSVYCLRDEDGALAWRFRAAPEDRRVFSYGQLESVWPVPGSVLVREGVAYVAAGRSSFLDSGIYLYRLDLQTGRMLSVTRINDRDPKTDREPQKTVSDFTMEGALPDILAADGGSIFMRHRRFDVNGAEQPANVPHLFSPAGFLDDAWWHRTYWLIAPQIGDGWGHWPTVGNQVPSGRLLVTDAAAVYGYGRNHYFKGGGHVGQGNTYYHLFAYDLDAAPKKGNARSAKGGKGSEGPGLAYRWSKRVSIMVRAMVLVGDTLFLAGAPDPTSGDQLPADALAGKTGGLLWAVSAADGSKRTEIELAAMPVFDGMAAANGRLYLATNDGRVLCFTGNK